MKLNLKSLTPDIRQATEKKLIGHQLPMSFDADRTPELWRGFMPSRRLIQNVVGSELYCLQVYEPDVSFTPQTSFVKWATVEVAHFDAIPNGMKTLLLPQGLYAVFNYCGRSSEFEATFRYIFMEWLPASDYELDKRPHFEVLGEKYKNDAPDSEEEIWIPIRPK